jgi:hypothetical protein
LPWTTAERRGRRGGGQETGRNLFARDAATARARRLGVYRFFLTSSSWGTKQMRRAQSCLGGGTARLVASGALAWPCGDTQHSLHPRKRRSGSAAGPAVRHGDQRPPSRTVPSRRSLARSKCPACRGRWSSVLVPARNVGGSRGTQVSSGRNVRLRGRAHDAMGQRSRFPWEGSSSCATVFRLIGTMRQTVTWVRFCCTNGKRDDTPSTRSGTPLTALGWRGKSIQGHARSVEDLSTH